MSNKRALRSRLLCRVRKSTGSRFELPLHIECFVCKHCGDIASNHHKGKCLFEATVFAQVSRAEWKGMQSDRDKLGQLFDVLVQHFLSLPIPRRLKLKYRKHVNRHYE